MIDIVAESSYEEISNFLEGKHGSKLGIKFCELEKHLNEK